MHCRLTVQSVSLARPQRRHTYKIRAVVAAAQDLVDHGTCFGAHHAHTPLKRQRVGGHFILRRGQSRILADRVELPKVWHLCLVRRVRVSVELVVENPKLFNLHNMEVVKVRARNLWLALREPVIEYNRGRPIRVEVCLVHGVTAASGMHLCVPMMKGHYHH